VTLDIRQVVRASLVALLLGCLGAGHVGAEEEEKVPPLGEPEARALLEEAAAMPRVVLDELARMGAFAHPEDVAALGNVPLTGLALLLPEQAWRGKTGLADMSAQPTVTPNDIRDLLRSGQASAAVGDSLLRADAITKLTLEVTGRSARGTVAFRHRDSIEGTLEWTAVVEEGRWRILSLWGPNGQRGVVWRRGQWNYAVGHTGHLKDAGPAILTAGHLAIPSTALPRLDLVGDLLGEHRRSAPPDVLHVAVTPRGRILLPSGVVSLAGLRSLLTESTRGVVLDVHGIRRNAVLRTARETPWHVVGWAIATLEPREDEPRLHLYVAAATEDPPWEVRHELGELAAEGVMALHGSKPPDPAGPAPLEIVVEADSGEVPAPTLHRVLREQLAATPGPARAVRVAVGSEGRVMAGHVLRVAELALRAGARDVWFVAAPIPPVPEGGEGKPAEGFTLDHVAKNPVLARGFSVRVGAAALRGDPPLAPLSRALWKPAGADLEGR